LGGRGRHRKKGFPDKVNLYIHHLDVYGCAHVCASLVFAVLARCFVRVVGGEGSDLKKAMHIEAIPDKLKLYMQHLDM
jgi:hypothetical protein